DDDLDVGYILNDALQLLHEDDGLVNGLEHLPVTSNEWNAHKRQDPPDLSDRHVFSVSAATPGSVRPPRNSSDAPPPVEMCVMRSARPAFFTAAMESPPPIIVVPFTDATAAATALVPVANASISNTPIGP